MTDGELTAMTQGAFVFWDPHATNHTRLREALSDIGQGDLCPPPHAVGLAVKKALADYARANAAAIKEAMGIKGGDFIVQRHKEAETDGYELVHVKREKDENDYSFVFSARAEEECTLCETWRAVPPNFRVAIQAQYEKYRSLVSGSGVGKMLSELVGQLHGTCVRAIGGVYYLPEDTVADWDKVVAAVESVGETVVTRARVVLDDSSIRTVANAITNELHQRAQEIRDAVTSGDLKADALENRAGLARRCQEKAKHYEEILGVSLDAVHQALKDAEVASAATALQLSVA
jgi:hypothetical protein